MIQLQLKDFLFNICLGGWVGKAVRILIQWWLLLWVQIPLEATLFILKKKVFRLYLVRLQMSLLCESVSTLVALKWFLSSMNSHVYCEITIYTKSFVTHSADERFFALMSHLVRLQMSLLCESLTTLVALKWFLTCMNPQVDCQMSAPGKCFLTLVADKWFFSNVC